MKTVIWLLRREFWENRAIWIIPAVIGGLTLCAALFGRLEVASQLPTRSFGGALFVAIAATYFAVMSIYSTWYLLDCLFTDRKDRSVLFWKSLPISDTVTVLSKLGTGLIVIPLVYFAAADLTTLSVAFIVSVRASSLGGALWRVDLWLQLQVLWLYLIAVSAVWYLPIAAYLLVISAWAKRAVMLWSILPPLAIALAERWFFGTHRFLNLLADRLFGVVQLAFRTNPGDSAWFDRMMDDANRDPQPRIWEFLNVSGFLSSPETWAGVAAGAVLVFCAIQLRMRRSEI
jgi:ABC-2 type transport system permease protein